MAELKKEGITRLRLFLDTNLFLCYAIDFEQDHLKSKRLFHGNYRRYTGIRVRMELNKIKKRRATLYKDLSQFYSQNIPSATFQPKVQLKKNDLVHLRQLLPRLKSLNRTNVLTYLRKIGRIIDAGIKHALSLVIHPLILPSSDLVCEKHIELCIGNANDARILVDALCWAESNSPAIFCTLDYSDIIFNRTTICRKICQIRAYDFDENPLTIMSLRELIT